MKTAAAHPLAQLFQARSMAIVGASDRNPFSTMAHDTFLRQGGSKVFMVNQRGADAHGKPAVTSCAAINEPVDAAYITVPTGAVLDAVGDAAAAGIRNFVVVSSGFAELGAEGASLQRKLTDLVRREKLNLLGPNSLGFINFLDRVSIGALNGEYASSPEAKIAIVSASGSTAMFLANYATQIALPISHMISTGNEAGLDTSAVIDYLLDDPRVKVIALFLEGVSDPAGFARVAAKAFALKKPIAVLKVGVTETAAALCATHTGALVGNDRVFQAACEHFGIVRARTFEQLVATATALASIDRPLEKPGMAVVSISGGACELIGDQAAVSGVELPVFTPETKAKLKEVVSSFGGTHNPIDITGAAVAQPQMWRQVLEIVAKDPQIGLTVCHYAVPASSVSQVEKAAPEIAAGLAQTQPPGPLLTTFAQPVNEYGKGLLKRNNLNFVLYGIEQGVPALGNLAWWSMRLKRPAPRFLEPVPPIPASLRPRSEQAALAHLAKFGVPVIPQQLVASAEAAVDAARGFGGAVALKIASADLAHKTEVGGVKLNVAGDEAVRQAYEQIRASVAKAKPGAAIDGIVVSPMRAPALELLVGVARDPHWGPVLVLGLGGVWVEVLADTALLLLPSDQDAIKRALKSLKAAKLLDGHRGQPAADLDVVAATVEKIAAAALALGPELAQFEINPLRVAGSDVEALDALAAFGDAGSGLLG